MAAIDPTILLGYWKITWMELWAQQYVDGAAPGYFEFVIEQDCLVGSFQFGAVVGWLDCRLRMVNGNPGVEWSWEGRNDGDPASGRGFADIVDGELVGHVFIHAADDSAFKAIRQPRSSERLITPATCDRLSPSARVH